MTGPRLRHPGNAGFRLLTIDGGGIKGLPPLSLLALLEGRYTDRSIGRYVDRILAPRQAASSP